MEKYLQCKKVKIPKIIGNVARKLVITKIPAILLGKRKQENYTSKRRTKRVIVDGIVPVSWLYPRYLRMIKRNRY